ncbi:DNAj [Anaeramoeba flamelloides]|uniref:DNAj n=1 Tax=Anaeramoeba flamelloides TaxID=1746091 RepID=A0ABQ8XFM1_9EUKA|nr:DNAj [Anaeramoeba flamelloides]
MIIIETQIDVKNAFNKLNDNKEGYYEKRKAFAEEFETLVKENSELLNEHQDLLETSSKNSDNIKVQSRIRSSLTIIACLFAMALLFLKTLSYFLEEFTDEILDETMEEIDEKKTLNFEALNLLTDPDVYNDNNISYLNPSSYSENQDEIIEYRNDILSLQSMEDEIPYFKQRSYFGTILPHGVICEEIKPAYIISSVLSLFLSLIFFILAYFVIVQSRDSQNGDLLSHSVYTKKSWKNNNIMNNLEDSEKELKKLNNSEDQLDDINNEYSENNSSNDISNEISNESSSNQEITLQINKDQKEMKKQKNKQSKKNKQSDVELDLENEKEIKKTKKKSHNNENNNLELPEYYENSNSTSNSSSNSDVEEDKNNIRGQISKDIDSNLQNIFEIDENIKGKIDKPIISEDMISDSSSSDIDLIYGGVIKGKNTQFKPSLNLQNNYFENNLEKELNNSIYKGIIEENDDFDIKSD